MTTGDGDTETESLFEPFRISTGVRKQALTSMESDTESTSTPSRTSNTSDDEIEQKICAVCGDKATGYHFHAMTCEGCKGFFRRTVKKGYQFTCPFAHMCTITKKNRRQCQACRFQKCLQSGMRSELIMSEEAVAIRRAGIKRKREHTEHQDLEIKTLTQQQTQLTKCLVNAHQRCFVSNYPKTAIIRDMQPTMETLLSPNSNPGLSSTSPVHIRGTTCATDIKQHQSLSSFLMSQLVEISTNFTHEIINFAKEIPLFRSLPIEDQITLLKGSSFEVCLIISSAKFNIDTGRWNHANDEFGPKDIADAGFQQWFIEPVIKFQKNLRSLELHTTEYALMAALTIFSPDRPGLIQHDPINSIQEELAVILKAYMNQNRPLKESRVLFPKLLLFLTDLRTLSEIHSKQILLFQEELWSPLLKEIFS